MIRRRRENSLQVVTGLTILPHGWKLQKNIPITEIKMTTEG